MFTCTNGERARRVPLSPAPALSLWPFPSQLLQLSLGGVTLRKGLLQAPQERRREQIFGSHLSISMRSTTGSWGTGLSVSGIENLGQALVTLQRDKVGMGGGGGVTGKDEGSTCVRCVLLGIHSHGEWKGEKT